jgi:hypothetical protein
MTVARWSGIVSSSHMFSGAMYLLLYGQIQHGSWSLCSVAALSRRSENLEIPSSPVHVAVAAFLNTDGGLEDGGCGSGQRGGKGRVGHG